ncbi:MAG: D-Ala-D-Ala carboxypeptidase family metallohydrolase [Synergistaceae bacterium]|nr:D-Ala-D-Ala carboxypeptidase family metallohydrolase [Synergistaceae bacterium]
MKTWYEPKYFVIDEFACKCGCGLGKGKDDALPAAIVMALDRIRGGIKMPLVVNSGFRCPAHNARSGGVKNSKHLSGRAADVSAKNYEVLLRECAKFAGEFGLRIIPYDSLRFVHLET